MVVICGIDHGLRGFGIRDLDAVVLDAVVLDAVVSGTDLPVELRRSFSRERALRVADC